MPTLVERLKLTNFLSFGPESEAIELGPLNVLIGPNASGKSNFLEAFAVLQATPRDLAEGIRNAGGIRDLLWKGEGTGPAVLDADVEYRGHTIEDDEGQTVARIGVTSGLTLRYQLGLGLDVTQLELASEAVGLRPCRRLPEGRTLYQYQGAGFATLVRMGAGASGEMQPIRVSEDQSVLSQQRDLKTDDPITYLAAFFYRIRLYRNWVFGANAPARQMHPADLSSDHLAEDTRNLALVLNRIMGDSQVRRDVLKHLERFQPDYEEVGGDVIGGYMRPFVRERGLREITPATRLSDGTLHWLSLLAVLLDPNPPPLVCLEEPELGLHPDMMHVLAQLLREASERTQLIVTTHSDLLVSAFTDQPEAVIVCEKDEGGTHMRRLDPERLREWLTDYSLGDLWLKGQIGGTRW